MITWNSNLKFVLSDVDETVADLYMRARPDMCRELDRVLAEGTVIFFITGQSLQSVQWRITDHIRPDLRARVLIAHCSGAEVWGFDSTGSLRERPFYSLYENALSESQKQKWREVVQQVIEEFALNVHRTMPVEEFKALAGDDPAAIMLEDRGPQITFEVVNGYNTPQGDMRVSIAKRLGELFVTHGVPVTARLAGVFAVDTALSGVSKTTAIT
ncbi:MAG TPA: hypothetical protein VEA59_07245, partial [Patescibacteria group bacterium]|nr:hypothetical protein [Patescibacteria group bacterium]